LVALFALALPAPSFAQDDKTTATTTEVVPPEAPKAETIAASDIAAKAVEVDLRLREINGKLTPKPAIVQIEEKLPGQLEIIDGLIDEPGAQTKGRSVKALKDGHAEWTRYATSIDKVSKQLADRSRELEGYLEELLELREPWTRTLDQLKEEATSSESIGQIDAVLEEVAAAEDKLRDRGETILKMQNELSERLVEINGILQQIVDAIENARGRLFTIDSAPIWQATADLREARPVRELFAALRTLPSGFRELPKSYGDRVRFHIVFLVVLVAGVFVLRRSSKHWDLGDASLNVARQIIARPLAAALFITLIFWKEIYPLAPAVVQDMMSLLILITAAILVPKLVPRGFAAPVLLLFALYFLDFLDGFLSGGASRRLLVLVNTILAFAAVIWWFRWGHLRVDISERSRRQSLSVAGFALLLLVSSLIANVVGATQLADVLTSGVLSSAAAGVLVFVIARLAQTAFALLLRSGIARTLNSVRRYSTEMKRIINRVIVVLTSFLWLRFARD
jgi:hypothetical protein